MTVVPASAVKNLARELDPSAWTRYPGMPELSNNEMVTRQYEAIYKAQLMWQHNPEEANDRIHCMCGSYMQGHTYDDGHSPVSIYDYKRSNPEPQEERRMLNYSKAVFLINNQVRAVQCTYTGDEKVADAYGNIGTTKKGPDKEYVFKTLDPTIKKDDIVIVPTGTRVGFTCVKVTAVDVAVDYDDNSFEMKWIVGKVDLGGYEKILANEADAIDTIKTAEDERRRKELRESVFASAAAQDKMNQLALTHLNGDQPEPVQPPAPNHPSVSPRD